MQTRSRSINKKANNTGEEKIEDNAPMKIEGRIKPIPHNNLLIANFDSYGDLEKHLKKNKNAIKVCFFGAQYSTLNNLNVDQLKIVKDNKHNDLITNFWGIKEKELLNILKKCRLNNPSKSFAERTSYFNQSNSNICGMFGIAYTTNNRDEINAVRTYKKDNAQKTDIDKLMDQYVSNKEKYSYLSNIIFKKYITLFYDLENEALESKEDLIRYQYFYQSIKNKEVGVPLIQITKRTNDMIKKDKDKDETYKKISSWCGKLMKAVTNVFNDKKYQDQVNLIKQLLKDRTYFKRWKHPYNIFQQDLMDLKIDFDSYEAIEYFEKQLNDDIKTKYELRFIQSKLICDYRDILKQKLQKLNKNVANIVKEKEEQENKAKEQKRIKTENNGNIVGKKRKRRAVSKDEINEKEKKEKNSIEDNKYNDKIGKLNKKINDIKKILPEDILELEINIPKSKDTKANSNNNNINLNENKEIGNNEEINTTETDNGKGRRNRRIVNKFLFNGNVKIPLKNEGVKKLKNKKSGD